MVTLAFKLVAITVRTIAKPCINWIVRHNSKLLKNKGDGKDSLLNRFFIDVGQKYNYLNVKINRKIFNLPDFEPVKKLSKERALENGVEFVSEFLLYVILLSLPFYEYYKTWVKNEEKEKARKQEMKLMNKNVELLVELNEEKEARLKVLKAQVNELEQRLLKLEARE